MFFIYLLFKNLFWINDLVKLLLLNCKNLEMNNKPKSKVCFVT